MSVKTKITSSRTVFGFKKPKLFGSAFTRQLVDGQGVAIQVIGNDLADTNISSTSSFRYDSPGQGIRSTQQIPLDWSLFQNHTFFNSAEVNVNVAFDRIINSFPFDGTRQEVEDFFDTLSGFEKYVYDSFPKNVGYLFFSGSDDPTGGSYIRVNDFAGSEFPTLSRNRTGQSILDPGTKSVSLEMHLLVASERNDNSVIVQKLSGSDQGITLAISASASPNTCDLLFMVTSGSHFLSASLEIDKGVFNHIVAILDRRSGRHRLEIYRDAVLEVTSSTTQEFGQFGFAVSPLTIGSGSAQAVSPDEVFVPVTTLSGALDEFRMFHGVRKRTDQKRYGKKGIYASDDLVLYFKFNEPTGSLGKLSDIVLDSSGNSLHSRVINYSHSLRSTGSISVPMTYEKRELNPVLFPAYSKVIDLNTRLLLSASEYDAANPNLITRLVPPHYLLEGQYAEGFQDEDGTISDAYSGESLPGSGELGSAQLLASLLYVWAKFFDEQKIMIDHFSNMLHVDYDDNGTVSDQFLPFLFQYYGFDVPNFFANASVEQFVDAENLGVDIGTSTITLQRVQNQLWRRILTNMREIINSKGTIHSVKSLIRSIGINPDSTFRIREFGGKTIRNLSDARVFKTEVSAMLNFSGSLAKVSSSLNSVGIPDNKPFIMSPFLSASRIETGFPFPTGCMVNVSDYPPHGISDNPSDGLLTSASFTLEGLYKFPKLLTGSHPVSQSLMRLNATGSGNEWWVLMNVVATSGTADSGGVTLWSRSSRSVTGPLLKMPITGVNIFDGNVWHVSAGRIHQMKIGRPLSSSWFLRVGRQVNGQIVKYVSTSSNFDVTLDTTPSDDMFSQIDATYNASGTFISVGSQSLGHVTGGQFLNSEASSSIESRVTDFSGQVANLRFWSKDLTETETREHIRNFKSAGVQRPLLNYNFELVASGAWERLRVDVTMDQPITDSNYLGQISLIDFSQNKYNFVGTGFEASTQVIKPETFYYSHLSPRFDEAATDNKVRIRSFLNLDNVNEYGAEVAPVYEITPSEHSYDDTRFTIDFSVIDALDEDIITIFATLDDLDNVLGDPNLIYSPDYPDLERLREIYFNRLTDRINLKSFFEFFKWFDTSIGMFIEQILPRKTNYLGTNFVIESHMLERSKIRYLSDKHYLDENLRHRFEVGKLSDFEVTLHR